MRVVTDRTATMCVVSADAIPDGLALEPSFVSIHDKNNDWYRAF